MKLADRYLKSYVTYAAMLLGAAIPILYFLVQFLVARRLDEQLLRQKTRITASLRTFVSADTTAPSVFLEPGIKFGPAPKPVTTGDRFSIVMRPEPTDRDNEHWRVLETTVYIHDKPYLLELSSSLLDKEELISGIVFIEMVILLLTAAGLFAINRSLSAEIWKPFYYTIDRLNNYKIEEDEVLTFEPTDIKEFTALNNSINSLTRRNAEVYQSQKAYIENASHEMQTPVAIQQVKLDLLLQTYPLSEEQYKLIAGLMDITQYSGTLHNCLLLLARIDNRQFRDSVSFSTNEMIEKLAEQYTFQAELKNVVIHLQLSNNVSIIANKALIQIMLGNFLNNAIRHNLAGGTVFITVEKNSIIFTNTGIDQALDTGKMFQRFQDSLTFDGNAGLGLHIAKKIAEYYGYSLSYDFNGGQHSFILDLTEHV